MGMVCVCGLRADGRGVSAAAGLARGTARRARQGCVVVDTGGERRGGGWCIHGWISHRTCVRYRTRRAIHVRCAVRPACRVFVCALTRARALLVMCVCDACVCVPVPVLLRYLDRRTVRWDGRRAQGGVSIESLASSFRRHTGRKDRCRHLELCPRRARARPKVQPTAPQRWSYTILGHTMPHACFISRLSSYWACATQSTASTHFDEKGQPK